MKIVSNEPVIQKALLSPPNPADRGAHGKFDEMLNEAMDPSLTKNSGPESMPAAGGMASVRLDPPCRPLQPQLGDRVEGFLDVIEGYRQQLANPHRTLRDIHPWVRKMETEMEKLKPSLQSLSEADGMREILDQTLITASVEIHKFHRGDYVPQ